MNRRNFMMAAGVTTVLVERGKGPAALFIHGFPLNSYQWRRFRPAGQFPALHSARLHGAGLQRAKGGAGFPGTRAGGDDGCPARPTGH